MTASAFFTISVGDHVQSAGSVYRVSHILSIDSVLGVDVKTNESKRLRVEATRPADEDAEQASTRRDLSQFTTDEWSIAQQRLTIIKPFIENPLRARADAVTTAGAHGVHVATFYRWVSLYEASGRTSSLIPQKRGRKAGTRLLDDAQEHVIQAAIDDKYLTKERGTAQDVVEEVQRMCRLAKIPAPNHNTIRARINAVPQAVSLRRRGRRDIARNLYEPIQGAFPGGDTPLAVVQIDHTPADIMLVDEVLRKPIGRPWITLALDVFTRMVVGVYIGFEEPSYMSVGMCMANAICPKSEYLASLGITGDWPVWGQPCKLHADNAREFRGIKLQRACEEYAIDLQWRPVQQPNYGGHIERLMGTMATEIKKIPGKTFSNIQQRKGYDSDRRAVMTLREFEAYLIDFIVNKYHVRMHSELGLPPLTVWNKGILGDGITPGIGTPPLPTDPQRIRLDFLPYKQRTIQPYGVRKDLIDYYDPVLDPYINAVDDVTNKPRKFLFRYDPKDISRLMFLDPADGRYVPIAYRDLSHPAISEWELRKAKAALKAEGVKAVDEVRIFEASERLRARVEDAKSATKAARRAQTRMAPSPVPKSKVDRTVPVPEAGPSLIAQSFEPSSITTSEAEDLFAQPVTAFDVAISR